MTRTLVPCNCKLPEGVGPRVDWTTLEQRHTHSWRAPSAGEWTAECRDCRQRFDIQVTPRLKWNPGATTFRQLIQWARKFDGRPAASRERGAA